MIEQVQTMQIANQATKGTRDAQKAANAAKGELQRFQDDLMNRSEAKREEAKARIMEEANQNWGSMRRAAGIVSETQPATENPMMFAFRAARERAKNQQ
jgi:hypothetical protein